jgi:hypothetical protein
MGRKNLRPYGAVIDAVRTEEGLMPVAFEGDSLAFLKATMEGKIWPTREQIYAAKSVLPIEHPPAMTLGSRNVDEIKANAIAEYREVQAAEAEYASDELLSQLSRMRKGRIEDCDERLRGWIAAGLVSDELAPQIRELYARADKGDAPFDAVGKQCR